MKVIVILKFVAASRFPYNKSFRSSLVCLILFYFKGELQLLKMKEATFCPSFFLESLK